MYEIRSLMEEAGVRIRTFTPKKQQSEVGMGNAQAELAVLFGRLFGVRRTLEQRNQLNLYQKNKE